MTTFSKLMLCAGYCAIAMPAASFYPTRLSDARAVYLTPLNFLFADGVADNTEALQSAINKVQETPGQGILFMPEGRYRLSKTVYIWPGIRLIGYGEKRSGLSDRSQLFTFLRWS